MVSASVYNYLSKFFNQSIGQEHISFVGGGSINRTFQLKLSDRRLFFCKVNSASKFPHLFEKEKNGLRFLEASLVVKTPKVVDCTTIDDQQLLILEWISSGSKSQKFWDRFGAQLAALHSISNEQYGFHEDNYMGSIPQTNVPTSEWTEFFAEHRIKPLLKHCSEKALLTSKHLSFFDQFLPQLSKIFPTEKPALLHGDLWSGNFMCNESEEPVLIDPAVYFGHRSVDLGMTTLFGGFHKSFYEAYHHHYPLPHNYEEQWEVCNLYPLLIHLLLFGKSYLSQIENILKRFQ